MQLEPEYGKVVETGEPIEFEDYSRELDKYFGTRAFCAAPGRFAVIFTDITTRKRTEEELRRLHTAIEQSPETVLITTPDGVIEYVNPAFETTTGYTQREAIGQKANLVNSGEHSRAFFADMWETLQAGEIWKGRITNQRKDGTRYTVEATISPVVDQTGQTINYVAVNRDITAKLALEDQLRQAQKMEAVGRLAGGVAHDFNNMLSVIIGHADMLLEEMGPDEPCYASLSEIKSAGQRSAALTRQLLAFARKQTVAPKVIDLNETMAGMATMLRRLIGEDIQLVWMPGNKLWPVRIDPSQVDQILANLCVNARDAIAGVGKVTIETRNAVLDAAFCANYIGSVPGAYVLLVVSDSGCGMTPETLTKVFEPFFTTKGLGKGTGLGLATVYGVVKQNNGFIYVSSQPGQGTRFEIYLPPHMAKGSPLSKAETDSPVEPGHETILLVEDEAAILKMTTRMLNRAGYNVLVAETPGAAIDLARTYRGPIHLLMTDVVMPEMNGRDLAKNILVDYPDIKRLFMSGYTADVIAHHGVLEEGVNFIQKPFSQRDLAVKVRKVLAAD